MNNIRYSATLWSKDHISIYISCLERAIQSLVIHKGLGKVHIGSNVRLTLTTSPFQSVPRYLCNGPLQEYEEQAWKQSPHTKCSNLVNQIILRHGYGEKHLEHEPIDVASNIELLI